MIALILARKGSKGLPLKNKKILIDKPLVLYTIEAAQNSRKITKIYVSTDDDEILKIAKEAGVIAEELRPDFLSTDNSLAIDTYLYMIDYWKSKGLNVKDFIVLQPTSPLRTAKDIDEAISLFENKKADSVISYTKETHPVSWHKYINQDLTISSIFEDKIENRQEKRPTYYPNGAIYIFKTELLKKKKYFSEKSFAYVMSRKSSVDIDDDMDFKYAEFLLKTMSNG